MNLTKFTNAVQELCDYYERKVRPTPAAFEAWHTKVKHVPDEAIQWIVRRITEEYETFPKNIPMAMRSAADEWWMAHPEKVAHKRVIDCPDCYEGLIYVERHHELLKKRYSYVFRCERCRQDTTQAYPTALLATLIADGYKIPQHMADAKKISWTPKTMPTNDQHEAAVKRQAREILDTGWMPE